MKKELTSGDKTGYHSKKNEAGEERALEPVAHHYHQQQQQHRRYYSKTQHNFLEENPLKRMVKFSRDGYNNDFETT